MVVLAITGTPGSGKSTLIKRLIKCAGEDTNMVSINVAALVKSDPQLQHAFDDEMDAFVMDTKAVRRRLTDLISTANSKHIIIETHTPSVLPRRLVDRCVVLRCDTSTIYDRLTERGYSDEKRRENVECEIMQVVLEEAVETVGQKKVKEFDNNDKKDLHKNLKRIKKLLN